MSALLVQVFEMAGVRSKNGVKFPVLTLGISTVMLYVVLLNSLETVNAVTSHGQQCNSNNTCQPPTSCHPIKQKCLCQDSDYYISKDQQCKPVINNLMCNGTTDSVICTLDQDDSQPITYQISLNSSSPWQHFSKGRAEIEGLSPGTHYTAIVKAQIQSEYYSTTRSSTFYVWTKPEKPTCDFSTQKIVPGNASDPYLYNITFVTPRGDFRNFVIDNLNGNSGIIASKTTISNVILEPGRVYNFSITSYNGNNEPSEVTTCSKRIASEKASNVRNMNITHAPCSTVISWSPPQHPNGKIAHYELSARDANGECKWNCTRADICAESAGTDGHISVNCSTADFKFGDRDRMSVRLLGLKPNNAYNVSIAAFNEAGTGLVATRINTTPIAAASVSNISLSSSRYETSTNSNAGKIKLKISWDPSTSEGNISYNVEVKKAMGRQSQDFDTVNTIKGVNGTEIELDDVLAHWNYEAHVQAESCKGESSWVSSNIHTTAENNPGQVQNLNVVQNENYAKLVQVTFDCLNESVYNGILSKYVINSTVQSLNGDEENDGGSYERPPDSCGKPIFVTISELEKRYTFAVKAVNQNYSGDYSETKLLIPAPKKPHLSARYPIIADVIEANSDNEGPNIKVKVCVSCLTDSSQGNVEHSGLTVCVVGDNNNCGNKDVDYQKYLTWKQAQKMGFTKPYRTTPDDWKENLRSQPENYTYEVGVDTNCDTNPEDQYCNGPLPEGKRVIISVVVCTKAGCEQIQPDAILVNKRPEKPPSNTVAITLSVLAALVLICVVAVLVSRRFLKKNIDEPETPERKPVKMCDFEEYVKKLHKDSDLLMQSEFEDLKTICMTFKNSCNEAQREANRVKNRFVDILPYDHSRVKLNMQPEEEETNDFINANYIPGFNSVREYIATQGPMHCTVPDFWRMIWEQKSPIIVMVSDLQENGRLKVDQYWPENLHEPVTFENVTVEMTNVSQLNKYIVRGFKISKGTETRKVTQFFLPGWCDFSANLSCSDVLEFARLMRQEVTPDTSGPITVHCSAGVGRTGTFIALDYFIQYVDKHSLDDEVDIYGYVLKMRRNRPRMVQAEIQYIFIYDAVQEIIRQKIEKEKERQENEGSDNEVESDGNTTLANGKKNENMYIEIQLKDEKCSYINEAFASDNSTLNRTTSEENNHKQ